MTREEAIRRLRYIRMDYLGYPPFLEPIDMAIEALQREKPLTEEIAIEFLQDSGWLPNHDKEIGNPPMLVRCKDCRHRDLFSCPLADNDFQKDDDYCSWGERSEK